MNSEIKKSIEEYVIAELQNLKDLGKQDEGYDETSNNGVKRIQTLVDLLQKEDLNNNARYFETRKIDITEIKNNSDNELKKEEIDINIKKDKQLRTDRIIKVVTDTAVVVVPIIFYNAWMNRGFEFEKDGTFTSNTFKNLFGKFKPNK